MRVDAINRAVNGQSAGRESDHAAVEPSEPTTASRALVAIAAPPSVTHRPMAYRDAPFLAQLLATKADLPQTRARRRAEPDEALAAYRDAASLMA